MSNEHVCIECGNPAKWPVDPDSLELGWLCHACYYNSCECIYYAGTKKISEVCYPCIIRAGYQKCQSCETNNETCMNCSEKCNQIAQQIEESNNGKRINNEKMRCSECDYSVACHSCFMKECHCTVLNGKLNHVCYQCTVRVGYTACKRCTFFSTCDDCYEKQEKIKMQIMESYNAIEDAAKENPGSADDEQKN